MSFTMDVNSIERESKRKGAQMERKESQIKEERYEVPPVIQEMTIGT